eukprot:Nk52_evm1s1550 gene=Nk52_evmTU1s1550
MVHPEQQRRGEGEDSEQVQVMDIDHVASSSNSGDGSGSSYTRKKKMGVQWVDPLLEEEQRGLEGGEEDYEEDEEECEGGESGRRGRSGRRRRSRRRRGEKGEEGEEEEGHNDEDDECWDVEGTIKKMDEMYQSRFYEWLNDELNAECCANKVKYLICDYEMNKVVNGVRWLVSNWSSVGAAKFLKTLTSEWPLEKAARLASSVSNDWALSPNTTYLVSNLVYDMKVEDIVKYVAVLTEFWSIDGVIELIDEVSEDLEWTEKEFSLFVFQYGALLRARKPNDGYWWSRLRSFFKRNLVQCFMRRKPSSTGDNRDQLPAMGGPGLGNDGYYVRNGTYYSGSGYRNYSSELRDCEKTFDLLLPPTCPSTAPTSSSASLANNSSSSASNSHQQSRLGNASFGMISSPSLVSSGSGSSTSGSGSSYRRRPLTSTRAHASHVRDILNSTLRVTSLHPQANSPSSDNRSEITAAGDEDENCNVNNLNNGSSNQINRNSFRGRGRGSLHSQPTCNNDNGTNNNPNNSTPTSNIRRPRPSTARTPSSYPSSSGPSSENAQARHSTSSTNTTGGPRCSAASNNNSSNNSNGSSSSRPRRNNHISRPGATRVTANSS